MEIDFTTEEGTQKIKEFCLLAKILEVQNQDEWGGWARYTPANLLPSAVPARNSMRQWSDAALHVFSKQALKGAVNKIMP